MLAGDRTLSRRRVLKQATVTAIGLAAAGDITAPVSRRVAADDTPLRQLADAAGIQVGMQCAAPWLNDRSVSALIAGQFNLYFAATEFAWRSVSPQFVPDFRPSRDVFNFAATDTMVAFAMKNNMRIMAEPLVWGNFLPDWLLNGAFTNDELAVILQDHISTTVSRYSTDDRRVDIWTVALEPITENLWGKSPENRFWFDRLGFEFMTEMPFRWAKAANPTAKVIIDQDFNEDTRNPQNTTISAESFKLVQRLLGKGVPLDGVGMELHVMGDSPIDLQGFKDTIARYHDLGVEVLVTSFDADMSRVSAAPADKRTMQAKIYGDTLRAFLDAGGKVFSLWGASDRNSGTAARRPGSIPTPFDENLNPKPAYFAMRDVVSQWQPGQ